MRKKVGIIKRLFCLFLIFLLSINSFAAIVSDNDGSAFITKAEFDALKASFQAQIDTYNQSIDSKIDGAIASYLQGIRLTKEEDINTYVQVGSGFSNAVKSVVKTDIGKTKQFKPTINYAMTKMDWSGDVPATYPLWNTGTDAKTITPSYTMGLAIVQSTNANKMYEMRGVDPYVTKAYYGSWQLVCTGAETVNLGWIAAHSVFAWNDWGNKVYKLSTSYSAPTFYDAGASNLTSISTHDTFAYFKDDDTWPTAWHNYDTSSCAVLSGSTVTHAENNCTFSKGPTESRHRIKYGGGNIYWTINSGTADNTFYIANDDNQQINVYNEKDTYISGFTEQKYGSEHSVKYWYPQGHGTSLLHQTSDYALKMHCAIRIPFVKMEQEQTATEISNLKDIYNGKLYDLTSQKLHFCAGIPLFTPKNAGDAQMDLKIKNTTAGYTGKLCIEIANAPFPSGLTYSTDFKTNNLVKLNDQTTWEPFELTSNTLETIKFKFDKDKTYYLRFYEKGKTYGGEIVDLTKVKVKYEEQ